MIIFKKRANNNLYKIVKKLLVLRGRPHTMDEAVQYMLDIKEECKKIENLNFHHNTTHSEHIKFGKKVYTYERNFQTIWYIIYDFDQYGNIIIKKILSNHQMKLSN